MIAEPPLDDGAAQVRRSWPETLVGLAARERGAVGLVMAVRATAVVVTFAGLGAGTTVVDVTGRGEDGALGATLLGGVGATVVDVGAFTASG